MKCGSHNLAHLHKACSIAEHLSRALMMYTEMSCHEISVQPPGEDMQGSAAWQPTQSLFGRGAKTAESLQVSEMQLLEPP